MREIIRQKRNAGMKHEAKKSTIMVRLPEQLHKKAKELLLNMSYIAREAIRKAVEKETK